MSRIVRATAAAALLAGSLAGLSGTAEAAAEKSTWIVVLDDRVGDVAAEARRHAQAHGGRVGHLYGHALKGFSIDVTAKAAAAIARSPRVSHVEPDQVMSIDAQATPTGIARIFADDNPAIDIDGTDDQRVDADVAVIDTGIDLDHPDLHVVGSTDCTNESGGPPWSRTASCLDGGDDDHDHGTHVAGTVAALDNDLGVVGVAPGARLWAVKVLEANGSGSNAMVIAGIDWVAERAATIDVANMSLGGGFSKALNDAVAGAVDAGVTMVVAAGNSDADTSSHSPASEPSAVTVSALADFDGEPGGTGAPTCRTDQDDTFADFSNWGQAVDIIAPGVCILSTVPGGYATFSGTSMASPHVAGAATLLRSGGASHAETVTTLLATGSADWNNADDGDAVKEPLLDVSSSAYTPTLVATGSEPEPEPEPSPEPGTLAFSGSSTSNGSTWTAFVHVSGATSGQVVSGSWSVGTTGACTTDADGTCTISLSGIAKRIGSVTWAHDGSDAQVVVAKP